MTQRFLCAVRRGNEDTMIIRSHAKDYQVLLYEDFSFLEGLLDTLDSFLVLDEKVYTLYREQLFQKIGDGLGDRFCLVRAEESNKTIETALSICEKISDLRAKRNSTLISIGGGIVQDITGFAANVLYRGIHWQFVPTTLLAACDSCIGGKTSLNYKTYKNILGTFFAPDQIHICTEFFQTLSQKDFESGLGEVIKFNVMAGEEGLSLLERRLGSLLERDKELLGQVVLRSLNFKKSFIEEDEFDRGVRIQLNFAHTFGHAFETLSRYEIPHGTAVAMGVIAANHVSLQRGWMRQELAARIEALLLEIIHVDLQCLNTDRNALISAMRKDKKQTGNSLTTVLMKEVDMELCIVHDTSEEEIEEAIRHLLTLLREIGES